MGFKSYLKRKKNEFVSDIKENREIKALEKQAYKDARREEAPKFARQRASYETKERLKRLSQPRPSALSSFQGIELDAQGARQYRDVMFGGSSSYGESPRRSRRKVVYKGKKGKGMKMKRYRRMRREPRQQREQTFDVFSGGFR